MARRALPAHGRLPAATSRLAVAGAHLGALEAHRVPEAFGFVGAGKLAQDADDDAVLDAWR